MRICDLTLIDSKDSIPDDSVDSVCYETLTPKGNYIIVHIEEVKGLTDLLLKTANLQFIPQSIIENMSFIYDIRKDHIWRTVSQFYKHQTPDKKIMWHVLNIEPDERLRKLVKDHICTSASAT
jgi:hypothetical protein